MRFRMRNAVCDDDAVNRANRSDPVSVHNPGMGEAEGLEHRDQSGIKIACEKALSQHRGNFERGLQPVDERTGVQIGNATEAQSPHGAVAGGWVPAILL